MIGIYAGSIMSAWHFNTVANDILAPPIPLWQRYFHVYTYPFSINVIKVDRSILSVDTGECMEGLDARAIQPSDAYRLHVGLRLIWLLLGNKWDIYIQEWKDEWLVAELIHWVPSWSSSCHCTQIRCQITLHRMNIGSRYLHSSILFHAAKDVTLYMIWRYKHAVFVRCARDI